MNLLSKKLLLLYLSVFITGSIAFPMDMENLIAYPVPFNLKIHNTLRVGFKSGTIYTEPDKVILEIYDINGDRVFTRQYSSMNIIWNGRNGKGKLVKPGLYILKISIENTSTGDYGRKMIRILVSK